MTGCGDRPAGQSTPTQPASTGHHTTSDEPSRQVETPAADFRPLRLEPATPSPEPETRVADAPAEPRRIEQPTRLRIPDDRPAVSDDFLKQAGISSYESKRLRLLSDLPADQVSDLPQLADRLFDVLETYFGQLPPATDGSEFQVTGCLIGDQEKFEQAGLMPESTFTIRHGRHRNYEFWIFNQEDDYYRRHLLLHEFTHCFMTCESGMLNIPPLWYIEGMAEYFATHKLSRNDSDSPAFGLMPDQYEGFEGWGRISEFRRSFESTVDSQNSGVAQLRVTTLEEICPDVGEYFSTGKHYSGSWAFVWFLQNHPVYRDHFEPLRTLRTRGEFLAAAHSLQTEVEDRLKTDWLLFQESLREGFDTQRSWPRHVTAVELSGPKTFLLSADREWQDTGLRLRPAQSVTLRCSGRFVISEDPKPWVCEPQGVSIDYFRGQPIGRVVAILVGTDGNYLSVRIPVGKEATITASQDCRVWMQVNDSCASRADNSGQVEVSVR